MVALLKLNADLSQSRLGFSRMWKQIVGSPPGLSWSQPRWAVKKALPTGLPSSSPFSAVSPRASWPLLCKTCEEKHWIWDSKKEQTNVFLLGNCHFCSQLSMALLSLAQSNQCADYCTTALSWTGSLNTGATEQDLQKLPTMHLKILSQCWGKASLPAPGVAFGFPPEFCCPDWDSRAVISSLDVAHLLQTGELAMNLGPGKGGGLGWRVHIWDDVTLGRFGYALCRWRDRWNRLLSDMGLCIKWYQMF